MRGWWLEHGERSQAERGTAKSLQAEEEYSIVSRNARYTLLLVEAAREIVTRKLFAIRRQCSLEKTKSREPSKATEQFSRHKEIWNFARSHKQCLITKRPDEKKKMMVRVALGLEVGVAQP